MHRLVSLPDFLARRHRECKERLAAHFFQESMPKMAGKQTDSLVFALEVQWQKTRSIEMNSVETDAPTAEKGWPRPTDGCGAVFD